MGKHCAATLARGDGTDNLDMEQKPLASDPGTHLNRIAP